MWNIAQIDKYLEDSKVNEVLSQQIKDCQNICLILSGDYEIELRDRPFTNPKEVPPVAQIQDGFVLISIKRLATEAEIQTRLSTAQTDSHRANIRKAYQGKKSYYDNRAGIEISKILRNAGYLTAAGHAKSPVTVDGIKQALTEAMEGFLSTDLADKRDALALRLVKDNPAFLRITSKEALNNPLYAQEVFKANPTIDLTNNLFGVQATDSLILKLIAQNPGLLRFATNEALNDIFYVMQALQSNADVDFKLFGQDVRSDWRLIKAMRECEHNFDIDNTYFPAEMVYSMLGADEHDMLDELIEYKVAVINLRIAEKNLRAKAPVVDKTKQKKQH